MGRPDGDEKGGELESLLGGYLSELRPFPARLDPPFDVENGDETKQIVFDYCCIILRVVTWLSGDEGLFMSRPVD